MENTQEDWSLIIEPKRKLLDLPIREVIRYRDLIWLFIKRDFTTQYKQTILGPLWFVITPLISTVMYSFVFGNLAKLSTDGLPHILFYYSGTMLWGFFSGCFTNATNIFVRNQHIFGKVYFPRLTVPVSDVAGQLTKIVVQFLCLMGFYVYYLVTTDLLNPTWYALAFPVILLWIATIGTGMGMIISALTTKYRDLRILVNFALGLAMYATPVVYPLSQIPGKLLWLAYINPLSAPIELFRIWFYGAGTLPPAVIFSSVSQTFFWIFLGLIMFNQNEQNFVDVF
ncbi:MAG: ABC transporter permease [Treponema sp.]|nr:MAG: ABC transporter permease [Treponema sp.]